MKPDARVLVVDDDPAVLRATAVALASEGFAVDEATCGQEAIEKAISRMPDVVLLDVVLPDLDGMEVCRRLKADPRLRDTMVTLSSGIRTDSGSVVEGMEDGADDYILRPVSNRELVARARALARLAKARRELRAQRDRADAYFDVVESLMVVLDREGRIVRINRTAQEVLGASAETLVGKDWFDLALPEEVRADVRGVFERLIAGATAHVEYVENPLLTRGGHRRIIAWHNTVLVDAEGRIQGTLSSGEDVTERRAEEQRREAQRTRLGALLEALPLPLCLIDVGYSLPFVNEAFRRTFGEPAGRPCYEVFRGRSAPCDACPTREVPATGTMREGEWIDPAGRTFTIFDIPFTDVDGSRFVLELHVDITARRKAEQAAAEGEAQVRAMLGALPDLLFIHGEDGRFLGFHASDRALLYAPPEAFIGKLPHEVLPPALAARTVEGLRAALATGSLQQWEYRLPVAGEERVFEARSVRLDEARVLSIVRDVTRRVRAHEEAVRARREWEAIFQAVGHPTMILTPEHGITAMNQAALRVLGMREEEVLGKRCYEVFHGPDSSGPPPGCPLVMLKASGSRESPEAVMVTTAGTFLVSCTALCDDDGRLDRVIHVATDITALKEIEKRLRASEERYRTLVESMAEGIIQADNDDRIEYVNERFCRIVGRTAEELIGRIGYEVFAPEDERERIRQKTRRRLQGVSETYESRMIKGDGSQIHVSISASPVYAPDGTVVGSVGLVSDITEHVHAERALRDSEARLRAVFEGLHDAVTIISEDGLFVDCNQRALEMFRVDHKERFLERRPADFSPPTQPDGRDSFVASRQYVAQALATGDFVRFDWHHQRADGEVFPAEVILSSYSQGGRLFLQGMIRDITELKRAEEERERLRAELIQAQKLESIGRLAGGVAHDFNNMLQVVLGHVEMALGKMEPCDPMRADLEEVRCAARRSADLTRQLLAFARRQTVSPRVVDLNEVIEGALRMLRRLIGEDIVLVWKPQANLWHTVIDSSQVDQILANLCVNARDAIGGVGEVRIATQNVVLDETFCSSHPDASAGPHVRLEVHDTGRGMSEEVKRHLFEPFFTTKTLGEGTGLGLSTVYGIVKQNGGCIDVTSAEGEGTAFWVYLPAHLAVSGEEPAAPEKTALAGSGATVLIVEDEPAILRMGVKMLEELGYRALGAQGCEEALRLARDHDVVDLVLTDVVMPGMSGRVLVERIREVRPGIKVIYMSGYTADETVRRGVAEGEAFIQKPFSIDELGSTIRGALAR